jgi:hypothetical protein
LQFDARLTTKLHAARLNFSRESTPDPGDRNGEPAENDYGCLIMAALVAALGIVTAIIVLFAVL